MSYQSEVLADNPIVYWPLDETSGTTANDLSGNDYTGTHIGAVPSADGVTYDGVDDRTNGEDGEDQRVLSGIAGSVSYPLTYECMFKTLDLSRMALIDIFRRGSNDLNTSMLIENGEIVGEAGGDFTFGTPNLSDGNWHHVAMVIESNTVRSVFVDSIEYVDSSGTSRDEGIYYARDELAVGARNNLRSKFQDEFNGEIRQMAYYKVALSAARIQAHYDASGLGAAPAIIPPPLLLGGL